MRLLFKGIRNVYEDTRMNNYHRMIMSIFSSHKLKTSQSIGAGLCYTGQDTKNSLTSKGSIVV